MSWCFIHSGAGCLETGGWWRGRCQLPRTILSGGILGRWAQRFGSASNDSELTSVYLSYTWAWARIILLKISKELANRCTCLIHTPTWSSKKCHLHSLLSGYPCSTCHAYLISSCHSAWTIAGVSQPDPCYASTLSRSPMLGTKRSAWVTNPMIPTSYLKTHIRGVYEVNVADLKRER